MAKGKKTASARKGMSRIVPLGDKVLIKALEASDSKSPAGIILPDTAEREKTDRGLVIAVGEGKRSDSGEMVPMQVKEGDKVLFQWGDKIEIDKEEYYVVGESNILAILKS